MRVTAQEDFTAVIAGGQLLDCKMGDTFKGDVARRLFESGAPVEVAESNEDEAEEIATPDELDIDGKIDDVLEWVGDDSDRALEAHSLEEAKGDKARPRLLSKLAELVNQA